jgi:hypothetical protein
MFNEIDKEGSHQLVSKLFNIIRRLNREVIVFNSKELDRLVLECILLVVFLLVKLCAFGEYNYDLYIYTHTYIHMYINIYNI